VADSQWRRCGQRNASERGVSISDADLAAFGVEHTQSGGCGVSGNAVEPGSGRYAHGAEFADSVDDSERQRLERYAGDGRDGNQPGRLRTDAAGCTTETSEPCGLADPSHGQLQEPERNQNRRNGSGPDGANNIGVPLGAGPVNGFWRDADWIGCRDKKFRAVEPGTFPLAHGSPARVGRLRLYGDAICVPVAQSFIASYMETAEAEE
jgi:DNA (cytosine-5)-methyltransferase 1